MSGIALLESLSQDIWARGPQAWADAYALVQGDAYEAEERARAKAQEDQEAEDATAQASDTAMQVAATLHDRWGRNR